MLRYNTHVYYYTFFSSSMFIKITISDTHTDDSSTSLRSTSAQERDPAGNK